MLNYPLLYVEHLSDRDLDLVARVVGARKGTAQIRARLKDDADAADELLSSEELFETVFGERSAQTVFEVGISPFLVFGVLVNKVARDLEGASFVHEWVGAGQRLPVFDVETLRDFIADGLRRFFVIEFLASFTKVASGVIWVRTARGYRRRRYSELDPVGLVEVVDALPEGQRAAGYRRLGDVSLFLSGVFPDHTMRTALGELTRVRLARSAGVGDGDSLSEEDGVRFFEIVGPGWYDRAVDSAAASVGVGPEYLRDVAAHFIDARRFLNFLSDRYLHRFDTGLMHPAF